MAKVPTVNAMDMLNTGNQAPKTPKTPKKPTGEAPKKPTGEAPTGEAPKKPTGDAPTGTPPTKTTRKPRTPKPPIVLIQTNNTNKKRSTTIRIPVSDIALLTAHFEKLGSNNYSDGLRAIIQKYIIDNKLKEDNSIKNRATEIATELLTKKKGSK